MFIFLHHVHPMFVPFPTTAFISQARYSDYWMKNCEVLQLELPEPLLPMAERVPSLPAAALADTEEKVPRWHAATRGRSHGNFWRVFHGFPMVFPLVCVVMSFNFAGLSMILFVMRKFLLCPCLSSSPTIIPTQSKILKYTLYQYIYIYQYISVYISIYIVVSWKLCRNPNSKTCRCRCTRLLQAEPVTRWKLYARRDWQCYVPAFWEEILRVLNRHKYIHYSLLIILYNIHMFYLLAK